MTNNNTPIKGVKAFNPDLTCRGFKFEEGKSYHHDGEVKACESGFHFCKNPLDTFNYYEPSKSVFHEVEGWGHVDIHDEDSKIACSDIKIGEMLSLHSFIDASIDFLFSRKYQKETSNNTSKYRSVSSATWNRSASSATGDYSASSATGDYSASSATGNNSASSATGNRSVSSATGYNSASSATGNRSASSATGDYSASSATGDYSASSATGNNSASSVTGNNSASSVTGDYSASSVTEYYSASSATGYRSASSATGNSSIAAVTGIYGKAMAGKYGCIALQWWNAKKEICEMRCAEIGCGDGSDGKLKAKVWYTLNYAGEFVEVI